jgi:hypothetical protein
MVLIVNKTTGRIINDYLLKYGDLKCEQLFDTWRRADGVVVYPNDCYLALKWDNEYDFNADEELPGYTNIYHYEDGSIILKRIIEPEFVRQQVGWLEEELKKTDYKVIKAYEASLIGKDVPYDFNEVHSDRQAIRDKINELENLLKQEGGVK